MRGITEQVCIDKALHVILDRLISPEQDCAAILYCFIADEEHDEPDEADDAMNGIGPEFNK